MAISLNTNLSSICALDTAKKLNENIQNSSEKIATGSRITRASDDAASLALSEKMKANIRSNYQSMRNANDAASIVQTLESNLGTITDISNRMRELAVQSASDTSCDTDKSMTNREFQQLKNEIKRLTAISKYRNTSAMGGTSEIMQSQLIDRAPSSLDFRVGSGTGDGDNSVKFKPAQLMMSSEDFNLDNLTVGTSQSARDSLGELDNIIDKVTYSRASLGALQNQLSRSAAVDEVSTENASAANSRLRDLDYATETAQNVKNKLINETNIAVQAQVNNNSSAQRLLKLLA